MEEFDNSKYIGVYPDGRPVPGSALDIAMRMCEAEKIAKEKEERKIVDDASEDFPGLKRMYELLKSDPDAGG